MSDRVHFASPSLAPGRGADARPRMAKDDEKTFSFRRDSLNLPTLTKSVPCLIVVEGASIGLEVRLDKADTVIGRAEDAAVSLDDRLASREHARIVAQGEGDGRDYVLLDNGSTNGTFLNNRQVGKAVLRDGDKVRIGSTVLRFSYHDEIDAEYHRRIYDLITYDDLTGLLTLRPFYRELEREIERSARLGLPLAVLMMDVDRFKQVNDTFGHQTGSHVLKECGRLIRHALRYNDAAARYGGEEFIAYLPNADHELAGRIAERVRAAIEAGDFAYDGSRPHPTISIGIAWFPVDARDLDGLVRRADQRLYRAKEEGRNRVVAG